LFSSAIGFRSQRNNLLVYQDWIRPPVFDMSGQKQIKPENNIDSMEISSSAPRTIPQSNVAITSQGERSAVSDENFGIVKNIYNEADLSKAVNENPTAVFNEIVELYKRYIAQLQQRVGSQADLGTTRREGGQMARIRGCYQ
jgi:hypothetical protein